MRVNCRQAILGGERNELLMIGIIKYVRHYHQTSMLLACKSNNSNFNVSGVMNRCSDQSYRKRRRQLVQGTQKPWGSRIGVVDQSDSPQRRCNLHEQL